MEKYTNTYPDLATEPTTLSAADPSAVTLAAVESISLPGGTEVVLTPEQLQEPEVVNTALQDQNGHLATIVPGPITLVKNAVYGSYRGSSGSFELELRVDIDGPTPLYKVSGDYYSVTGYTKTYFGSFVANGVLVSIASGVITITGNVQATWSTAYTKLKVTIKQTTILQTLAPAQLQWIHATNGSLGALYVCNFAKRGYRTIRLEQDTTAGVTTPFVNYNTGSLPSGGPARVLSINTAFAEAGVDLANAGIANVVPLALAGVDAKWTDAELHNGMVNHFSLYQNVAAWDVWLLHAYEHILGSGLYGIMFDQQGLQRQGCAVFYRGIGGTTTELRRLQLYTCVHELGHCFNLLHSWQKSYATPPKPNNPSALSWMNYPWGYPGGAGAFWSAFAFRFDNSELAHIRHGFRNNVIMGGNPFATGASLEDVAALFERPVVDNSNLQLELEAHRSYFLGEPVDIEIKLKTTSFKNNQVVCNLHPDMGFVTIGIKKPGGNVVVYEPLAEKCIIPEHAVLNISNPSIYENAYIGFHKDGFIFDQPGKYEIMAVYYAEDGSRIVSEPISIRVKNPVTAKEDELADLFLEDEIGYLLKFKGSDAAYLSKGNALLDLVIDKYKGHPMATFAQYVKGVNEQRTFKTITPEKELMVRRPDFAESTKHLSQVVEKSKAGQGLDNIRLNKTMRILAQTYLREGNTEEAQATLNNMVAHFNQKSIKPHVKEKIAQQAAKTLLEKP